MNPVQNLTLLWHLHNQEQQDTEPWAWTSAHSGSEVICTRGSREAYYALSQEPKADMKMNGAEFQLVQVMDERKKEKGKLIYLKGREIST